MPIGRMSMSSPQMYFIGIATPKSRIEEMASQKPMERRLSNVLSNRNIVTATVYLFLARSSGS